MVFVFFFRAGKNKREKPSEHAIEEFKRTDPDLICYREIKRIKIGINKLHGNAF